MGWEDLDVMVKAKKLGAAEANQIAAAIQKACKDAQGSNVTGDYKLAKETTTLSYVQAQFALSELRKGLGGTKDTTGTFKGYNVKCVPDEESEDADAVVCTFQGTKEEKAALLVLAHDCLQFVRNARDSKKIGPYLDPKDHSKGRRDDVTKVESAVNGYLEGFLK